VFPVLSDLAGNTSCVTAPSAANEQLFGIDGIVVNSGTANLKEPLIERPTFLTVL